jgi:hypothetical protein
MEITLSYMLDPKRQIRRTFMDPLYAVGAAWANREDKNGEASMNWDSFMTDDQRNETKRRGGPLLLIVLGALIALIGFSTGGFGIWLGVLGLFSIGVAALAIKQNAAKDAIAAKRRAEDAEIRADQLRKARGLE